MCVSSSRKTSVFSVSKLVVAIEHRLRERNVAPDEGVEGVAEHVLRDEGHPRDVDQFP